MADDSISCPDSPINPSAELNLEDYSHFGTLLDDMNDLICKDSIPVISFSHNNKKHAIIPINGCVKTPKITSIKSRNRLEIYEDSIVKSPVHKYPMDSLSIMFNREISNNGRSPMFSESPDYLILQLSYDDDTQLSDFLNTLQQIAIAAKDVDSDILEKILIMKKINPPPLQRHLDFR